MAPEWGNVVLIPVPFTDLPSQKRRPVIFVSNDSYNRQLRDVVVVAMTSNPSSGPYHFEIQSSDLLSGELNRPGTVRVDKIYTLDQRLIVKRFGRVDEMTMGRIGRLLHAMPTQAQHASSAQPTVLVQLGAKSRPFAAASSRWIKNSGLSAPLDVPVVVRKGEQCDRDSWDTLVDQDVIVLASHD